MALLVKQLVTRSGVLYRRPAVATPRFLSINRGVRGVTTKISDGNTAKSSYEAFMNRFPITRKVSRIFRLLSDPHYSSPTKVLSPNRVEEDEECVRIDIYMSAVSKENVRISVDHNIVCVKARNKLGETLVWWFELPDFDSTTKIYNASDIMAVYRVQLGWIQLIIPKLKKEEREYDVDIKSSRLFLILKGG